DSVRNVDLCAHRQSSSQFSEQPLRNPANLFTLETGYDASQSMTSKPPLPTNNRLLFLAIPAIILTALLARSLSLQWSPLPYNIDGLSELRIIREILSTHHLDFSSVPSSDETYVPDMPMLALLLAFFSSALGVDPASNSQLMTALLGSISVSILYLVFRQHWKTHRGAIASALVLALTGSFVFSSGCTWKESLGFVLVAFALYAYPLRQELPYRLLLTLSLLLSPFTHHHITIVLFVMVTFAVIIDIANRQKDQHRLTRQELIDGVTVVSVWAVAVLYYWHVHLPYIDYLSPTTDLYLYLAVASLMLLTVVRMSLMDRPLTRLPLGLAVPLTGAVLMVLNYYHPVFPGLPGPASLIAVPFLAYLILVVPAWEGARIALPPRGPTKNLLLAMILGPLSLIIFALLRSNDAMSQLIVYRTFDFVIPAFALLIGVGFAYIVKGRARAIGMAAGASLVIICASTLPIAYSSQELFGVENQTYWFEYDAVQWFSEHGVESYASDQRLSETGARLFDLNGYRGLPYDLREGIDLNSSSFYVLETDWNSTGAQEFPFGVVVIDSDRIIAALNDSNVFYVGGPAGNHIIGLRTR
ncbi:MAG: hypothetical protein KJ653_04710, partial [Candidatus Thermoplasmatota archaeon]|nr:hypothetical protein [Candidatus Thermoplasmatota archaeon]